MPRYICIDNKAMELVQNVKYLGVNICDNCTDDQSILNCVRGLYMRGNQIKSNFKHCDREVKLQLFWSYCSSLYCCALLSNFNQVSYRKVKVCHNNIFRFVCNCHGRGSISMNFVNLNVPNLDVIRRKLTLSLLKRLITSVNELLVTITNSSFFMNSHLFQFWMSILFL